MGRHGGPSRGCAVCRQRKIKCDETFPNCMRCVKSGRECSGPLKDIFMRDMTQNFPSDGSTSTEPTLGSQETSKQVAADGSKKSAKFRRWRNTFVISGTTSVQHSVDLGNTSFEFVYESAKHPHDHPGSESDPDTASDDDEPRPSSSRKSRPRHLKRVQTFRPRKPRSIGNPAAIDPFGVFPVRATRDDEVLVHNYIDVVGTYYTYKAFPRLKDRSRISGYFVPLIHSAQPSFHAAMAVAAANQIQLLTNGSNVESISSSALRDWRAMALFHGAEACRFMNERLNATGEAVSDTSICAVFYMILAERMAGAVDRANIHLSGLSQLIKLRGGMQNLPYMVGSIINYADVVLSVERLDKPYFPLYDVSILNPYYTPRRIRWMSALRERPLGSGFSRPNISGALPDRLLDVIREINGLATEFETIAQTVSDAVELGFWEHRCFVVQHEILSSDYKSVLTSPASHQDPEEVVRALCEVTCLIFFASSVNCFSKWFSTSLIRNPKPSPKSRFSTQSVQLTNAISLIHTTLTLPLILNTADILELGDFFIWILFFAGFLAQGKQRRLFVKRIRHLAGRMGLRTFDQVKDRLEIFLYRESIFDEEFRDLWGEAMASGP